MSSFIACHMLLAGKLGGCPSRTATTMASSSRRTDCGQLSRNVLAGTASLAVLYMTSAHPFDGAPRAPFCGALAAIFARRPFLPDGLISASPYPQPRTCTARQLLCADGETGLACDQCADGVPDGACLPRPRRQRENDASRPGWRGPNPGGARRGHL